MNLESLRDRLTREHFLRPRCQFGRCRKTVHKGGIYCINHFNECRNKGCWATVSVQKVTDRSYSTLYIRLDNSMELLRTDGTIVEVKRIKRNF